MNFIKLFKKMLFAIRLSQLLRFIDFYRRNIKVARGSFISRDVNIGRCTRINNPSYISECDIGAFCAIGGRLVVRGSNHSTNTINMQDWAQRKIIGSDVKVAGYKKGRVTIGNGVWIGDSVIILPGANVGNGAVIGAGSVVTKSIPPFSIAVGNPARVIKYRFSSDVISIIKDIEWWSWSYKKMNDYRRFFEIDLSSINSEELLEEINRIGVLRGGND
ncbi:CatB-related O-acetyltransferase [Salinivibrio sp. ML290]|uniref:CatB-related O-acetyltransferase n=1 Tax=Salinivibrio sp. ML290 TaxID=1909468 RepID=UPI0009887165|nr:CatB-related O-acetyltransferase [Salinivibrio sp. ML290]OOE73670.1 hypothetical protein BZG23_11255 [Salinivibrio sp. ML290]